MAILDSLSWFWISIPGIYVFSYAVAERETTLIYLLFFHEALHSDTYPKNICYIW